MKTSHSKHTPGTGRHGFTLTELMLAMGVTTMIMAGAMGVYLSSQRSWHTTSLEIGTATDASFALSRMVSGIGTNLGFRAAVESTVSVVSSGASWTVSYQVPDGPTNAIRYLSGAETIQYRNPPLAGWVRVANGINAATASKSGKGINLMVRVGRQNGRFSATNEVSTFIAFRN